MAIDIEAIGISFDTASVNTGAKALDNLGKEADSASKKVDGLGATSQTVAQKIKAQNAEISTSTIEMRKNAESVEVTSSSISKLINKYDPLSSQLKKVQADFKALDDAASKGQIGAADLSRVDTAYANMQKELQALTSATGAYGNEAEKAMGKSMFATAGARRELIVMGHEAIQGNFSRMPGSLMVLAERTGVSAAGFGVMAAAGLGVAAVLGSIVLAAVQGAKEFTEMNRAIDMTSNFAGQTTSSIRELAKEIANTSTLTMGQSKQVVMELAASGKIGAESFTMISNVVAEYSRVTGKAADDSTKDIIKLFSDPKKGAEELNSTMHFLSASEMERIDTLQRTGHVVEAQLLLADKLKSKLDSEVEPLGILAKSWDAVKKASSSAWDSMMAIGRPDSAQEKIDGIKAHIKQLELQKSPLGAFGSGGSSALIGDYGVEIDKLKLQLQSAEFDLVKKSTETKKQAADAAKIDNDNELAALRNNNSELFKHQKIREEIARLQAAQVGLSGQDAKINQDAIKQLELQLVNKKAVAAENKREKEALKELQKEVLADEAEKQALRAEEQKAKQAYIKLIDEEQAKVEALSFSEITALDKQIAAIKLKNAEIGKTPEQISLVKAAVEDASIAQLQLEADTLRSAAEYVDMSDQFKAIYIDRANALDIEISKRKEISALLSDQAILEKNAAVAKKYAEDWKKAADEISRSLTDALLRGFEAGKSFAQNFKDTLINMFKTLILRPIIQGVVNMSGVGGVAASITTMFSGNANAGGVSGGASSSIFDNISKGFSSFTDGIGNFQTGFASSIASFGNFVSDLGGGAASGGMLNSLGSSIATNSAVLANIAPFAGAAIQLMSGNTTGAAFTTAGAIIGSFVPVIGTALGGMIGGMIGSFVGNMGGTEDPNAKVGSRYTNGALNSRSVGNQSGGTLDYGAAGGLGQIQDAFSNSLTALLSAFGKSTQIQLDSQLRAGDVYQIAMSGKVNGVGVGVDGWNGQVADLKGFAELALGKGLSDAIQSIDLPSGIKSLFAGITDSTKVTSMLNATIGLVNVQKELASSYGLTVDKAAAVSKATGLVGDALTTFINKLASTALSLKTPSQSLLDAKSGLTGGLNSIYGTIVQDAVMTQVSRQVQTSSASSSSNTGGHMTMAGWVSDGSSGFSMANAGIGGVFGSLQATFKTVTDNVLTYVDRLIPASVALPDSLEGYDALLKSINTSTAAGATMFAQMFSMRDQFIQFTNAMDSVKNGVKASAFSIKTPQAQLADMQAELVSMFGKLNLAVPKTKEELLALAGTIDYTTQAGLDLAIAFPSLVSAFQTTQTQVDSLAQSLNALDPNNFKTLVDLTRAKSYVSNGISLSNLPSFDVGSNSLPSDMTARVHQGERIIPAADNRALMQRLSSPQANSEALLAEVVRLRQETQAQQVAIVQATQKMAKILDKMDNNGVVLSEVGNNGVRTILNTRTVA